MQYKSVDGLFVQLRDILRINGTARNCRTIFILLPDEHAWSRAIELLRLERIQTLRLSEMCDANGRLPAPARLLAYISNASGNVALIPAHVLLNAGSYPARKQLFERLASLKRSGGSLIVPLLACSMELVRILTPHMPAHLLEINGDERPVRAFFCAPALPCDGISFIEWLSKFEVGSPPINAYVKVPAPLRFAGNGIRVLISCYALLAARLSGLEFIAEPKLLSEQDWRRLYLAIDPNTHGTAREVFSCCVEQEARGELAPGDPLRLASWILRLSGLRTGAYTRRILAVQANYPTLEEAVALELLSAFDNSSSSKSGALSPDRMSAGYWLDIRAERGAMLRALGVRQLPPRYWQLLSRVPEQRKLMYSSLCTPDERSFCKRYLTVSTACSHAQLARRKDIMLMYPELIDEIGHMPSTVNL